MLVSSYVYRLSRGKFLNLSKTARLLVAIQVLSGVRYRYNAYYGGIGSNFND
jgi:hypothetical protein